MGDAQPIYQCDGKGRWGGFEMKSDEPGGILEAIKGQGVAIESAAEFAEFFLLIGGKNEPGAGHVFEKF